MKNEIKFIFQNIIEWLKFAEAKHAGLLFLNSGVMFGILSVLNNTNNLFPILIIYFSLFCFGLSMIFSIVSLYPVTHNKMNFRKKIESPNLYFTSHLSTLDVPDLKSEMSKIYPEYLFDKFDEDLLNQIIVNSAITTRKYKIFKLSIIPTSAGLGILLITLILKILFNF
jgi:hypothetical protein